jgi:hypothetical protein
MPQMRRPAEWARGPVCAQVHACASASATSEGIARQVGRCGFGRLLRRPRPRRAGARLRLFRRRAGPALGGASPHRRRAQRIAANIAELLESCGEANFGFQTLGYRRYFSSMIEKTPRARGMSEKELRARIDRVIAEEGAPIGGCAISSKPSSASSNRAKLLVRLPGCQTSQILLPGHHGFAGASHDHAAPLGG